MLDSYDAILSYLYQKYYVNHSEFSEVTSSHWRKYGEKQVVSKRNGKLYMGGVGFGSFRKDNLENRIKYAAEVFLNYWLLRKHSCDHLIVTALRDMLRMTGQLISFDHVKQALSVNTILQCVPKFNCVCIIGDGYGFMGNILRAIKRDAQIISINLGRTLIFDIFYTKLAHANSKVRLVQTSEDYDNDLEFCFLEAEKYDLLSQLSIDLFINIASMQEMDNKVIEKYFQFIRESNASKKYLYCCNRVEKKLPDGTITRIDCYPWDNSIFVIDELCPWYQKYPKPIPPFWRSFDGPIKHILALIV